MLNIELFILTYFIFKGYTISSAFAWEWDFRFLSILPHYEHLLKSPVQFSFIPRSKHNITI